MIEYREKPTDEINYSMGRSQMSQHEIWETEDNGGFKKVIIKATVSNLKRFKRDSVEETVKAYQKLIDTRESLAVLNLDSSYAIVPSDAYGLVTNAVLLDDNTINLEITLLDVPNGNVVYKMLKGVDCSKLEIIADGMYVHDRLMNILTFKFI